MKFLRILGFSLALIILATLILANIFPQTIRHWIKQDNVSLKISDNNLKKISLSQLGDHTFNIITEKNLYHPYERILVYASIVNKISHDTPKYASVTVEFFNNGKIIKSIDGKSSLKLKYNKDKKIWGTYWYPEDPGILGNITIKAKGHLNTPGKSLKAENKFFIDSRKVYRMIPKGLSFLGISDKTLVSKHTILSVQARTVNWTYIPSWMNILSADGVMMLGGLTETYKDETSQERPWQRDKINETLALADKVKQNGGTFAVWIKAQEVEGKHLDKLKYKTSLQQDSKGYSKEPSRISILDKNRKKHIINILNQYASSSSIDYIGLSHVFLTKKHDLELFDKFLDEFHITLDDNWDNFNKEQKLKRFMPKLKDSSFQNLFNKWKSYAFFDYLSSINDKYKSSKRLFYFADTEELVEYPDLMSIVFNAGIDFLVLNFKGSFLEIKSKIDTLKKIKGFEKYYDRVVISYEVDFNYFEDKQYQMSAIENYVNANMSILLNSSKYYQAQGLMINGLYRIMPGRRGPYPSNAWMLGFGQLIYEYQNGIEKYPLSMNYFLDYNNNKSLYLQIKNVSSKSLDNIKIQFHPTKFDQKIGKVNQSISSLAAGDQTNIRILMDIEFSKSQLLEKKHFLGLRLIWNDQHSGSLNNGFINLLAIPVNKPEAVIEESTN